MIQKQQSPLNTVGSLNQNIAPDVQPSEKHSMQESRSKKRKRVEELKNHVLNLAESQMDSTIRILRRWMNES
ncbi:hypothetical protein BW722_04635 [Lawsonia intracellularis]|uniref:hypothetical protein n=1 Tax=Lawsonia intracellularis TaxID=29546 RepID=UPI0009756477|nr:hypothetical protein [Lawsonia intracellularis]OMQ02997.1 hypothetical protein BW722_04635 [Lawsonia intracellularis]